MAPFSTRGRLHKITKKRLKLQTNIKKIDRMKEVMQERLKRLKTEMEDINEEQMNIREEQRHVREKFEEVESECQKLKGETKMMIQMCATTQLKLAIMFRILKAKEDCDFATAASLTELLRQIVAREKEERP
ncbi:hypothetical protein REPUB_Repub04eG0005400 [Reevesia pubescens]